MKNFNFEKPDAVFAYAPVVEDICIEFGIDRTDVETITCMYEVFKRMNGGIRFDWNEGAYNEGYKEGWNDAIEEAESKADDLSWEIGSLKKN
jgi:hypothetical protein